MDSTIKIHLGISTSYSATYGLDFDLADLSKYTNDAIPADLLSLGGFLDASADGSLQFGAYAGLSLDLGIDFSAGTTTPNLIVYASSGVDIGVRVTGQNLNINATLGPAGFAIVDGSVVFDGDGLFDDDNQNGIEDEIDLENPAIEKTADGKSLKAPVGATWVDDDRQDNDFALMHFGPLADITDIRGTIDGITAGTTSLTDIFGPTFSGVIVATLPGAITSDIGSLDLPGPIIVEVPDVTKLFSTDPLERKDAVQLTLPDFSDLLPEIPGLIQLLRDPAILLDGVDSGLGLISKLLAGKAATKLPLIGDQLRQGSGFIEEFRAGFLADLTLKLRGAGDTLLQDLQLAMFDLFASDTDGANGLALGILKDYNGDGVITKDDVVVTFRGETPTTAGFNPDNRTIDFVQDSAGMWVESGVSAQEQDAVVFNLHLGQSITFGTDLDIEWGLPGLELDINGSPSITAGWDLFFGFGVSITDYFFLDGSAPASFSVADVNGTSTLTAAKATKHELSLNFDARLTSDATKPFKATGRLFFLQLDATDKLVDPDGAGGDDADWSHISGAIFVDLTDPGTGAAKDGRVTVRELFSKGAVKPITAGIEAEAVVNLALAASVGGSTAIPRLLADFHLDWDFQFGQAVETPNVEFKNVNLDLGSFVSDFLKPIVDKVNEIIEPFDPVLDALQTRIPVLSDIMGRDYTVLDLAVQFGKVDRRFVDAVLQVRQLVADIAALPSGVNILIPIGELTGLGSALMTKDGAKGVSTAQADNSPASFGNGLSADQQKYKNTFSKSTSITGGGFGFPILQPANAMKLLLGQDATLITYDIPRLEATMSMSQTFRIWGPLVGKFNGSITAYADFAVGFDTKGFNTYRTSGDVVDILDGFYVSDRANADGTGADVYEAGFTGRIGIGGAINAAVVEAGIEGFFILRADLDLKDPNDDGKIRGSEIIALIDHPNGYGPLNLGSIRLRGEVGARAYVDFWAPFDWYNAWEWEFARLTLFDKTFTAPDVTPKIAGTVAAVVNPVTGATENTLTLNAGPTANKRNFISTSDVGEEFVVSGSGKNITVSFTNTGHTQSFTNVDRIVMSGGKGNDRLILGPGITTAATFDGGEGDDYFVGGDGNDIVFGGSGNDTIIGGLGNNNLDGGDGADTITGSTGNDILIGGLGDDVLNGGGGNDTYRFGDDWGRDFFEGEQTGTGTFDFTPVTKDLTLNIGASGAQGSTGNNFISFESTLPYIAKVMGGSGNDVTTVAATGTGAVTVDGGLGSDQYVVSFGRLNSAIKLVDTGSGVTDSDSVTIRPLSRDYTISVGDLFVSGTKAGLAATQRAEFSNDGVENLTVDAKANGGSIVQIAETISYRGDVRLLARQALIGNTVDAGDLRIESTQEVNIAANVNAHDNGNVTVLVNSGNITITEDVMSSKSASGFIGDGSGLVHLFTSGGAIVTGTANNNPGRVLAAEGSLLLRGTNGSIGTLNMPIYSTVALMAASTSGNGLINLHESDGVVVGTIASIEGITTTGGILSVFNDAGELKVVSPISLSGGNGTLTTDQIQIEANISSPNGNIFLRPEGDLTPMAIGNGVSGTFALAQSEISHLVNGLASIQIGLPLGRNLINLGDATFRDVTLLQNPVLGGHINQTGIVNVTDGASFTIFGSGHTTELNNQNVAGNIDIIDSAIVRQGETVTLTSTAGAININFDLDGTAGGADESLILSAAGDVTIKGAIGSVAQLGTLRIIGGTNIHFEGSVNVKHLIMDAGATFTVDGTFNAEDIQLNNVVNVTFHSGVALTTALTSTGSVLNAAVFEGQVSAPSITLTAKQLVDFYQLVDVTSTLNVQTTNATGDIIFRQQVNAHSGDITVRALDDITFIGPVAGDDLTVTTADALAFQANLELTGALLQSAGTGVSSFSLLTAASANLASAGVLLGGISTFTGAGGLVANVGGGSFSASNSVSAPNGPLTINARSISFQSTVSAASAGLTAIESITVANASSFTLTGALAATTTSGTIGEIKFSGPVDIGTNATLNTPRGLTFQNTLAVDGGLTVQAASSAAYQGAVSVGGSFIQQNGVTGATSFTASLQAGMLNLQSGSFSFSGDVNSDSAASITANTGGITATSNVSAAGTLTANAASNLALQGATTAHSMALTAAGTITVGAGGLNTSASPSTGNIVLTTTGPVAGNSVTLNGAVQAKGGVMITATQGVLASNTINAASLDANGSALTFNSLVTTTGAAIFNTTGALNVAASLNAGGPLTVGSAASATFGDSVTAASATINATNTINIAVGGLTTTVGAVSLTTTAAGAGNAVSALGLIDAAGALSINTPRGASLNLVQADSLTASAASLNLNAAVTTTGATTLAAATGNITAGSTITAGGALQITRAKAVTFAGLVSADSVAIGQGATDSIETVAVGVGGIDATNDLTIRTTVAGTGNGITSQGPLSAGTGSMLTLNSVRGVDVTGSISAGDLTVQGSSITLRSTVTAANDATLASASAISLSANLAATGDLAVTQAGSLNFGAQVQAATLSIANTGSANFNGKTTIGGAANIAVIGDMGTSAEFSTGGALAITSVRDLTFGGFVSAASVNIGSTTARTVTSGAAGLTATGDVTIVTNVASPGNGIITNGPVNAGLANTVTLTSVRGVEVNGTLTSGDVIISGSPVTIRGTVNAADDLTLSSPGIIAITSDLNITGDLAVTQAGALSFGAQVQAATLSIANTASASFTGQTNIAGPANIAVSGDMNTTAEFTAGGALAITSVRDLTLGGFVSAASVNIGATTARAVTVGSAGLLATGDITIATNVAGSGSGIITTGPVTGGLANTITLTSVRGVEVNGTMTGGDLNFIGAPITIRGVVNGSDDVTLTSSGTITVLSDITASDVLAVTQAGALTFGAQVEAASLSIANTASASFTGQTDISGAANIAVSGDMSTSAEFSTGGALAVTSVRDLTFGGFVSAASVNIGSTTARTVTVGAAGLTAAGDITIATNIAGTGSGIITNGPVTGGAANTVTLTSVRGVEVNGTLNGGDLNLSGSPVIVRGVVNASDDLTLTSAGTISVLADVTAADDIIVAQAGTISFGAKVTAADLLVSNTGNATFTGEVALSNTANLALTGDLTTSAAFSATNSITVPSVRDVSFGGLVSSATVNIGSTNARTISVAAAGVATSGALTLRSTDAAGALNLNGPLTASSGAVTLSALGAMTSTATITGDSIAATSPAMALGGALVADGAGISGTIALDSTAAGTGSIIVGGVITSTGSLLVGNTTAPQSAALNGALNIGQDLIARAAETISAGAQAVIGRDVSLTTTSTTAGEVRLNGTLSTGRDLLLTTPRNATFLAPVTVGGAATITNAAALQFDGALNVTGALTQVAGTTSSRFASISAASIDINSPTVAVTNAVTATTGGATFNAGLAGKVTVGGNTNIAGALSVVRADEVILTGNVSAASVSVGSNSVRTMTFGTNLNATSGDVNLVAANGAVSVLGTLNAAGALNIPTGTVITLNGAVSAANATIAGGTLVSGGDFTTTSGNFAVTTAGDVSIAGKTTVAQTLSILGSDDVTLTGAVTARDFTLNATSFLAGGAFTSSQGDANFTTTGNIRVVGLTSVAGNLSVATALNTTFQGQVAVTGALTQANGGGATRFEGVTSAASLNVRTAQQIFAGSTFRVLSGDMRLEADEIDFFGGTNAVQGTANLVLRPYLAGTSIDVGSPTPTGILDLSDVDINALQDGFTQITIGRFEDGTGAMLIGSSSFKDNVAFHAGSITVESNTLVGQVLTSLESIEMTARTGSILTNDDVFGTDAVFTARDNITINNKVEVTDFITFQAGSDTTGNITLNGALITTAANGRMALTAGSAAGNISSIGTISTFDLDLTAASGAITQTAGNTKASDILALAQNGITLLTTADHISARVTGTGNLNLTDTNPSVTHFLDLGSKTDVNDGLFTANGNITVFADQNVNAYRVAASGAVTIETGGEVYLDKVSGAPVNITGTILIDEDRMTNGEEIRFDGNIRLLRDITLTSNGGDIIITGRVNGTAGQDYGLNFNAGGGNVTIGNGIGNVTPLEFLQVNNAGTFTMGNGARVENDIEINANAIAISAPLGSIVTTGGGALRLLPNAGNASIDIGGPAGGTAAFSLNDAELAALGDGFSRIQLGQRGGTHNFQIESARFLDDLEINGDNVTLLKSSVAQAVNGLSVVNGADDNDITINARTSFTQGSRAALTAGRNGDIAITADNIALDNKSRGLIRGFGELLLQPFTTSQAITLGGSGAGFEITTAEFGALGETFSQVIIGRADGAHAVNIQTNLSFRDSTLIRTPMDGGSVTIGNGTTPTTLKTVGRTDHLRIESAGTISVDANVKTVGRSELALLADVDGNGAGDLLISQNLTKTNATIGINSELGAIRLQGENIKLGIESAADKKVGTVSVKSVSGAIDMRTNVDGDADGDLTFRHIKSIIATNAAAKIASANHGGTADLGGGAITTRGLELIGFDHVIANATKVKSSAAINVEALRSTFKAKSAFSSLAEIQITGNQTTGVIALEQGAVLSAVRSILLDAADVQRDPGAALKSKSVVIDEL